MKNGDLNLFAAVPDKYDQLNKCNIRGNKELLLNDHTSFERKIISTCLERKYGFTIN